MTNEMGGGAASRPDGPSPFVFHDVLVTPYEELLERSNGGSDHRGGPLWPDWEAQTVIRHCRRGVPDDHPPEAAEPVERLPGPFYWGGPIVHHFGHQVADFSMRLVPSLAHEPGATVLFASDRRWAWTSVDDSPSHVRQILSWLGVPPARRRFIARPSLIGELRVLPQAEQHHGPGPSQHHLDRMDELVVRRLPGRGPRSGVLYASRAAMHARLAGEVYLEVALRAAGARVLRPESVPVAEQLERYVAAEVLLFPEGSAVQSARLLGRDLGHVRVIRRRPGDRIAEDGLRPRASSLAYHDALLGLVCGLDADDRPFEVLGIPVLDVERLIEALRDVLPSLPDVWDGDAYAEARDADIIGWLERSLASPRVAGRRSREHIVATLEACGLHHLVDVSRTMMRASGERPSH